MIPWPIVRKFPKFAVVAVVLVGSTGLFCLWWWLRRPKPVATAAPATVVQADNRAATLPDRIGRLFVADGTLMDAENGEVIYKNWLRGETAPLLYYQPEEKKIVGRFERGFARYALDGTREAILGERFGTGFNLERNQAIFAREHDLWQAEVDWREFKLINERRVTSIGKLEESYMVQNLRMGSAKFMLLFNARQMLRIDLSSGDVTPSRFGKADIRNGVSPDGGMLLLQDENENLVAYDLDSDSAAGKLESKKVQLSVAIWTDPNHGLLLAGNSVIAYDRSRKSFQKLCRLPELGLKLQFPSPTGRYVFAQARGGVTFLVDTMKKSAEPFANGGQHLEWIGDDAMLMARDTPDSKLRGTWYLKVGEEPTRVLPTPYTFGRDAMAAVLVLKQPGWVVVGDGSAFFRMDIDGKNLKELGQTARGSRMLQGVEPFPGEL